MQNILDILAIHEGFGHNPSLFSARSFVEEIFIVLLQGRFPAPIR
jgi:hypothetical protein